VFGYSAREAIGQPITLVIPADRQSEEREILTRIDEASASTILRLFGNVGMAA
jgi:hypothetical protein